MHIKIPHKFSQQEGVEKVRLLLNEARSKLGDKATIEEERWEANVLHFAFSAQGQRISGQLTVQDKVFELDAKLPLMMKLFEGKIARMIEDQAKNALG